MKLTFKAGDLLSVAKDAAIFLVYENKLTEGVLKKVDQALGGALRKLKTSEEFTGKENTTLTLPTYGALKCQKIILIGCGKKVDSVRGAYIAGHNAALALKKSSLKRAHVDLGLKYDLARQFLLGAVNADYEYSLKRDKKPKKNLEIQLCGRASQHDADLLHEVSALAEGVKLTRDLVAGPANYATPKILARAAQGIARRHKKVRVKVLGLNDIRKHKMGGLLGVSQGSSEEPRFIIIEYKGGPASQDPIVFVGKGITFDAGGISLKPPPGMDGMKWDMGGGGGVIGAMEAIAGAGYKVNAVGLVPASENLPDGAAYKPSDVLTMMNGKTVEITNTDAEGRLILADALVYACKYYQPRFLIDMATLTGACAIFLGDEAAGLMTPDDKVAEKLLKASDANWDRLWRLPLYQSHHEAMKSPIADLLNGSRSRKAGSSTAAAFLNAFVEEKVPWAHLDIAGMAWQDAAAPGKLPGATGYGVQLLATFAKAHAR